MGDQRLLLPRGRSRYLRPDLHLVAGGAANSALHALAAPSIPRLLPRPRPTRTHALPQPPPTVSVPPVSGSSAVPRTSSPRGVHGSMLARSSTTIATFGLACRARYFFDLARLPPPTSIAVPSSARRKPTGTTCGALFESAVASRASRWLLRYSSSSSVKVAIGGW